MRWRTNCLREVDFRGSSCQRLDPSFADGGASSLRRRIGIAIAARFTRAPPGPGSPRRALTPFSGTVCEGSGHTRPGS